METIDIPKPIRFEERFVILIPIPIIVQQLNAGKLFSKLTGRKPEDSDSFSPQRRVKALPCTSHSLPSTKL